MNFVFFVVSPLICSGGKFHYSVIYLCEGASLILASVFIDLVTDVNIDVESDKHRCLGHRQAPSLRSPSWQICLLVLTQHYHYHYHLGIGICSIIISQYFSSDIIAAVIMSPSTPSYVHRHLHHRYWSTFSLVTLNISYQQAILLNMCINGNIEAAGYTEY